MAANPLRDLIEELAADREPQPPGTATVGTFIGLLRRFGHRTFEAETWGGNYNLEIRNVRHDGSYVLGDLKVTDTVSRAMRSRPRFQRPRINFTSTRTINELGKKLNEMTGDESWIVTLEELCIMLLEQFEAKGEHNVLRPLKQQERGWPYLMEGGFLPDKAVSSILADGGKGKTMMADLLAVALATGQNVGPFKPLVTGPVLLADWEHDEHFHEMRISRICEGLGINPPAPDSPEPWPGPNWIHHFRPQSRDIPLTKCVDEIRETVQREGCIWVVLDSIGYAAGSDLNLNEVGTSMTNALKDLLPTPVTFLAHVSHDADGKAKARHFGSRFFWNGSDVVYGLGQQSDEPRNDGGIVFEMNNPKANIGKRRAQPIRWLMYFEDPDGAITCASSSMSTAPLHTQIGEALKARGEPMGINEIAFAVGMAADGQRAKVRDLCEQMAGRGILRKSGEGERTRFDLAGTVPKQLKEGPPQASFAMAGPPDPEPDSEDVRCHCGAVVWMYGSEGQPLCEEHAT